MRLTRVIHTQSGVFYGPLGELVPDVAQLGDGAEQVILFVDGDEQEAHGFVIDERQAKELARMILGLEVKRVLPPRNGAGG